MEDVTDTVFRQIICELGRPDIFFTEFTNLEGFFSKGEESVGMRLKHTDIEKPLIAQVWGKDPVLYKKGAEKLRNLGFDGIDINMGCPKESVIKSGSCAALIKNPELAKQLYISTKEGAQELPVSIKTRIGFNEIDLEGWVTFILSLKPDALTLHLRTVKEMSKVPAHFELMKHVSQVRDRISPNTVLICNGDIESVELGETLCRENSFQGYMIGRGIFKNPTLFSKTNFNEYEITKKLEILQRHIILFRDTWGRNKNFEILKKYFKIYVNGFDGAKDLRESLMNCRSYEDTFVVLEQYNLPKN